MTKTRMQRALWLAAAMVILAAVTALLIKRSNSEIDHNPQVGAEGARELGLDSEADLESPAEQRVSRAVEDDSTADHEAPHLTMLEGTNRLPLSVHVLGYDGKAYPGVEVQVAPQGHAFVTFGRTDNSGRAEVAIHSRTRELTVSLALCDNGKDLLVTYPLTLRSSEQRGVTLQVVRPSKEARQAQTVANIEDEIKGLADALSSIEAGDTRQASAVQLAPRRYAAVAIDGASMFGTAQLFGQREFDDSNELITVELQRLSNALDSIDQLAGRFGVVHGRVVDRQGEPVPSHVVKVSYTHDGSPEEVSTLTNADGDYSIRVRAGSAACTLVDDDGLVDHEFTVGPGDRHEWNPLISLSSSARFLLPSELESRSAQSFMIQSIVSAGEDLVVRSYRFDAAHRVDVRCSQFDAARAYLLYEEGGTVFPLADLGPYSPGERIQIAEPDALLKTVEVPLSFPQYEAFEHESKEAFINSRSTSACFRIPLKPLRGGAGNVRLPAGEWEVALLLGASGSCVPSVIDVIPDSGSAQLVLKAADLGTLSLQSGERGSHRIIITQVHRSYFSRAAELDHNFESQDPLTLDLPAGEYRAEIAVNRQKARHATFQITEGQTTPLGL